MKTMLKVKMLSVEEALVWFAMLGNSSRALLMFIRYDPRLVANQFEDLKEIVYHIMDFFSFDYEERNEIEIILQQLKAIVDEYDFEMAIDWLFNLEMQLKDIVVKKLAEELGVSKNVIV